MLCITSIPYITVYTWICVQTNRIRLISDVYCSLLDLVERHLHSILLEVKVLLEGKNLLMNLTVVFFSAHVKVIWVALNLSLYARNPFCNIYYWHDEPTSHRPLVYMLVQSFCYIYLNLMRKLFKFRHCNYMLLGLKFSLPITTNLQVLFRRLVQVF